MDLRPKGEVTENTAFIDSKDISGKRYTKIIFTYYKRIILGSATTSNVSLLKTIKNLPVG